jgi:hypothetical protein
MHATPAPPDEISHVDKRAVLQNLVIFAFSAHNGSAQPQNIAPNVLQVAFRSV